jgi:NTP pyrophosphatase (non-canonical NTP hydrolase)
VSDGRASPADIEQNHLTAIYEGDALYVVNPDGYIGPSTSLEIGWAMSFHKPIFFHRMCSEKVFNTFGSTDCDVEAVRKALAKRERRAHEALGRFSTVEMLQQYVAKAVVRRGFAKETPKDILLLLVEEVGELAKAIRKLSGLKTDTLAKTHDAGLSEELADVFIYLLDLANSYKIDLLSAMRDKEAFNERRSWSASPKHKRK